MSSMLSSTEARNLALAETEQEQQQRTVDSTAASFDTFPSLSNASTNRAETLAPAAPPTARMNDGLALGIGAGVPGGVGETAAVAESGSLASAAGRGHSTAAEGHLPAAQIATHDVTNPFTAEAAAAQLKASEPAQPGRIGIDNNIILNQLPAPTHGEDAKLASHLSLVAADLKTQVGFIGQHIAVGARTAGLQTKDAWVKLKYKVQEMKEDHQQKRAASRDLEHKQQEERNAAI